MREERGSAVVTVLLISVVLAVIGSSLLRGTVADLNQTTRSEATTQALQAAEAGINDYIAKLTEDHLYYAHWVHRAEATRLAGGTTYDPSTAAVKFDGTLSWTYPNGRDGWLALGDGLEYDLQINAPNASRSTVQIVATGRRVGDPSTEHTIEAFVRTASIADYQMISNTTIRYGGSATTDGKIYAGVLNGVGQNVIHGGTVNADILAEGRIYKGDTNGLQTTGSIVYNNGAQGYDSASTPGIRSVLPTAIDFTAFTGSITDVQRAAEAGIYLDDTLLPPIATPIAGTVNGWWLTFQADGNVAIQRCSSIDLREPVAATQTTPAIAPVPPVCTPYQTVPVPTNGAIYVKQTAVVSGVVRGRATVATPEDVAVAASVTYKQRGTDVLGLIAQKSVIVPAWATTNLDWEAATLAISGSWHSAIKQGSTGTLNVWGSTATMGGGYMTQFWGSRNYKYDTNLLYLQPPYFPVLEDAYTIVLMREVK